MTRLPSGWLGLLVLVGALCAGLVIYKLLFALVHRLSRRTATVFDDAFARHCAAPARLGLPLWGLYLALPGSGVPAGMLGVLQHAIAICLISVVAWAMMRLTRVLEAVTTQRFDLSAKDNLRARQVHTQFRVFRRIVSVVVILIAFASILMTFDRVRQLGASLLASAGLIGIIAGVAAQRTLSNLIAGIQIALTQPIRVDDVVIVEGEWGRIEEITFTYVVVRIWDYRRLVVPISHFVEKPFQNWTRVSAELLGTVYLYADYRVPVDRVRSRLHTILKDAPQWDGKVWGLQVTDVKQEVLELRALMSAADSSEAWDLRCHVREQLIAYIRDELTDALPRWRGEIHGATVSLEAVQSEKPSQPNR